MKDEYISFSIAGAVGVLIIGLMLGVTIADRESNLVNLALLIMLLLLVRRDARENVLPGTYQRGWFVWRRKGPVTPNDPEARV